MGEIREDPREGYHRGDHTGGGELMATKYKENQESVVE